MMEKAIFLDRDGVINIDKGYIYKIEEFEFVEGIFHACQIFISLGYRIIVVSNQSGIGRGYYSEDDFHKLTDWMCEQFSKREIPILDVKFCPYHPSKGLGKYKQESACRKPNPGMILEAAKEYGIDLSSSIMIGDKGSDAQAADAAGIKKIFLLSGPYTPEHISNAKIYSSWSELLACEFK